MIDTCTNFTIINQLILIYICFALFSFVLHTLSDSLLFTNLITPSSSQKLHSPGTFCSVPGPVPDSNNNNIWTYIAHVSTN